MAATPSTNPSPSPIESASKTHSLVFTGYVGLLVLTVFATYFVWRSGNKVQEAIKADADARIAEARLETERLRMKSQSRLFTFKQDVFIALLRDKPRGHAVIWYVPNDEEAWLFAQTLASWLIGSGWDVNPRFPLVLTEAAVRNMRKEVPPEMWRNMPLAVRANAASSGLSGLSLWTKGNVAGSLNEKTSTGALATAIAHALGGGNFSYGDDSTLAPDTVRIVVGQKFIN